MVANLEEQLKVTSSSLRNGRETIADKEAEISKLRLLLDQSERSGDELKRRLESRINAIEMLENEKVNAEEHQGLLILISSQVQFILLGTNFPRQ